MSKLGFAAIFVGLLVVQAGCGRIPLISENRQNFPPWEKLPEGNGITYLEKFTFDPGTDPIYLAKMRYDDDAALQRVITTFGLVPRDNANELSSFAETLGEKTPQWFRLDGVTDFYVFPPGDHEYVANLWVNAKQRIMILERSWW